MKIINVTPHEVRFLDPVTGEEFVVPPSGVVINAHPEERLLAVQDGVEFVRTCFVREEASEAALRMLREEHPSAIIVGSIIAAQAYPGEVVAMTPAPGFERVPVDQKRMNPRKFTVFPREGAKDE